MLAAERQMKIMDTIRTGGSAEVDELALLLNVSTMTIRRDLEKLRESGTIERCHGGAVLKAELATADKKVMNHPQKEKIARRAAAFVRDSAIVFLDSGTTTFEIAVLLAERDSITVVTNDLEIAHYLADGKPELIVCGGSVEKASRTMYGCHAAQMMGDFHFDVGFFGADGAGSDFKVFSSSVEKAFLKRQLAGQCTESYLTLDESKFGRSGRAKVNMLSDYTGIITTKPYGDEERLLLGAQGIHIIEA